MLQDVDLGAREQRPDDFKRRILGRRANQDNPARLDVRQKSVLLRLVEPVDFVHEQHGRLVVGLTLKLGLSDNLSDVGDAREHRTELHVMRFGVAGNQERQRGLAGPGRSPENHGMQLALLNHPAQRLVLAQDMLLTQEFAQVLRPHPVRQRLAGIGRTRCLLLEQTRAIRLHA